MLLRQSRLAQLLTLPVTVVLLALLAYPLISTLASAFVVDGRPTLAIFHSTIASAGFWQVMTNTLVFTLSSTALSMLLGLSFAYALEFVEGGRRFFSAILIIPLAMMPVVSALTFGMMLDPALGVVNALLDMASLPTSGWHTETSTALLTVVLVDVWQWTPFCFAIIHAGFRSLPQEVSEAARIDGANAAQELFGISLPLLRNVLLVAFVFRFMEAFKAFDAIYVMTQGGPGRASETLVVRAYKEAFQFFKPETAASIGVLLLLVTLLCARPIGRALIKVD
jgi:multiple sugar transport system permease protein